MPGLDLDKRHGQGFTIASHFVDPEMVIELFFINPVRFNRVYGQHFRFWIRHLKSPLINTFKTKRIFLF